VAEQDLYNSLLGIEPKIAAWSFMTSLLLIDQGLVTINTMLDTFPELQIVSSAQLRTAVSAHSTIVPATLTAANLSALVTIVNRMNRRLAKLEAWLSDFVMVVSSERGITTIQTRQQLIDAFQSITDKANTRSGGN
jgi:hypothetical protein